MMPEFPAIGSGMINAGTSIGSMGYSDFKEDGKINYSVMNYTKTGIAGFASGTISGGIAKYGISIGLKGVSNSVFASVGDMAGNAAAQYILTGKVDAKQMVVSGATSFVCAEAIRNAAKIVTPKSMAATATKAAAPESPGTSKTKTFFADETGELSFGKPGASGFDDGVGSGTKVAGEAVKTDFIVSPKGEVIPIPKGSTGPIDIVNPAGKTSGFGYTGGRGGANEQVSNVRIMDPTPPRGNSPGYPNGYVKYENNGLQGVDPITGRTLPNSQSHFPLK